MSNKQGFIIYLTPDATILQGRLPRGLVHDQQKKTLRSETGTVGRSIGGFSGKVEGSPFSIGTRLVLRITDLEGNVQFPNELS